MREVKEIINKKALERADTAEYEKHVSVGANKEILVLKKVVARQLGMAKRTIEVASSCGTAH